MGPAISILGILFLVGALLFFFTLIVSAFSLKGRGGLSGRPLLTAFAFALAIALMAGPALTLTMNERYGPAHAFRLFFGRPPVESVRILESEAGSGTDYSRVMLLVETTSKAEFEAFAGWAQLRRNGAAAAPAIAANDLPEWWTPNNCAGEITLYAAAPDASWSEKWAAFCDADNRAHAYAIWIDRE